MSNRKKQANSLYHRAKPILTPLPNPVYLPQSIENTMIIASLEEMEKKVLGVITDVEDKLNYLKTHSKKYQTPEPVTKRISLNPINIKTVGIRHTPFKITGKSIEKKLDKYSSRKNSMVKLMQSTNSFNLPKIHRENLMNKLVKEIKQTKKPCIQGIFTEILKKESIFEAYKNRHLIEEEGFPSVAYGIACDNEKTPPLPVLTHSQEDSLVLNRYKLSLEICCALSKAISVMPYLKSVHLDENGLTDTAGAEILKGMISQGGISSFYYTHNEIGPAFLFEFQSLALNSDIEEMNFKGCKVTKQNFIDFIWSLRLFESLKKLTLAEVGLSSISIEKLIRILNKSQIMYLDLSWNSIPQEASIIFFEGLLSNDKLQFLDYSWNPLTDPDQTEILCKLIKTHQLLMHLNLSHTQIPNIFPYMLALSTSPRMQGLHLTGNSIDNDALPSNHLPKLYPNSAVFFNMPTKALHTFYNLKQRDVNGMLKVTHKDQVVNILSPKKNIDKHMILEPKEVIVSRVLGQADIKDSEQWGVSEHCWVCERWGVYHLKVTLDSLHQVATPDIFYSRTVTGSKLVMKASFNNWKDVEFEVLDEGKGEYELSILIPAGKHRFLIICDDTSVCVTKKISTSRWNRLMVNEITMPLRELEISHTGEMTYEVLPIFDKNKSVFRYFLEDTETILKASFDSDIKHMNPHKFIRDYIELGQVIEAFSQNYGKIKTVFTDLIISKNYPFLDLNQVLLFCNVFGVLDEYFNAEKVRNIWEIMSSEKEEPLKNMSRFEFFEFLLRATISKYHHQELPLSSKFQKMLNEHFYKFGCTSRVQRFRKERMYNLEVNEILDKNLQSLQNLMTKYKDDSGRWITLQNAESLVRSAEWNICTEQVIIFFAISKMAVIDEFSSENSYDKLQFVEMLEFVCRVIDYVDQVDLPLDQKLIAQLPILFDANKIKHVINTRERKNSLLKHSKTTLPNYP